MTTNCIVPPKDSYKDRLYTTGAAGYPGCTHIDGEIGAQKDFSALIEQAKHCSAPEELEHGEIIGGFAHNQVLALASQIVEAVNSGAIKNLSSWQERWTGKLPQLLYGFCQSTSKRCGYFDCRLCQIQI